MSSASNLGYGNITPLSNVDDKYVNIDSSNYSARFTSNEVPGYPGLVGAKNNVDAAAGKISGGSKIIKRKIKNITKHYKRMKSGSRKMKSIKNKLKSRHFSHLKRNKSQNKVRRSRRNRRRNISRGFSMSGGYSQYQNNLPMTPGYQVAGVNLPSSQLGLANPPPITKLSNCVNCVDNYNHYINKGFSSKGN